MSTNEENYLGFQFTLKILRPGDTIQSCGYHRETVRLGRSTVLHFCVKFAE